MVSAVSATVQAAVDPLGWTMNLIAGLLAHMVDSARVDMATVLDRYLFTTVDVATPGLNALTENPDLRRLNGGFALAADAMLSGTVLFASLRAIFERSLRSRYDLKVMLPKLLLAIVLIHGSMLFMQLAIDLNNALSHVAIQMGTPLTSGNLPWAATLSAGAASQLRASQDIFHALFAVAVVVAVVILMLAYIVRGALLNVLIVTAPLAALLTILPETRSHARSWLHLFTVTVFMQAVQMIVLRVAMTTAVNRNGGIAESLYSLATLYIVLKVPGALNTAEHLETKAKTMSHGLERSVKKILSGGATHRRTAA